MIVLYHMYDISIDISLLDAILFSNKSRIRIRARNETVEVLQGVSSTDRENILKIVQLMQKWLKVVTSS